MLCPHCNTNLKYRERSGKKCSACKREFAFEPKTNRLNLHDVRFRKALAKISRNGKYFYTTKQLQHFLSQKKVDQNLETGCVLTFAGILLAIILAITQSLMIASIAAVIIGFVWWYNARSKRLPQSFAVFERDVISRWQQIYGALPNTLIVSEMSQPLITRLSIPNHPRGVLVCPETDVHLCLSANQTADKLGLILFNPVQPLSVAENEKLEVIRERRDLPIFVLHEASPAGCLLKEDFAREFKINPLNRRIIDIGLRPRQVMKSKIMFLRAQAPKDLIEKLSGKLAPEETAWLKKGYYTPLLALTPERLIAFVTNAVSRDAKSNDQTADRRKAQTVGFMTWIE